MDTRRDETLTRLASTLTRLVLAVPRLLSVKLGLDCSSAGCAAPLCAPAACPKAGAAQLTGPLPLTSSPPNDTRSTPTFCTDFSADGTMSTDASELAVTLSAYILLYVLSPMNSRPCPWRSTSRVSSFPGTNPHFELAFCALFGAL